MCCTPSKGKYVYKYAFNNSFKFKPIFAVFFILLAIFASCSYLYFAWNRCDSIAASEATQLAQALESMCHTEQIVALLKNDNLAKPEYEKVKNSLAKLVENTSPIQLAYFLVENDNKIVFLIDSKIGDSFEGSVFEETDNTYREIFQTGKTVLTKSATDQLGSRVSVIVPVKDTATSNIAALFVVDFSAAQWNSHILQHMVPDVIISICFFILSITLLYVWMQHSKLKTLALKNAYDEVLYKSVFEQAPIGIAIMTDMTLASKTRLSGANANPMYEKVLGRTVDELQNVSWVDITHPDDVAADLEMFEKLKKGEIDSYTMEKRYIRPDGSIVWTNMTVSHFRYAPNDEIIHLCLLEDITMHKQAEEALKESERSKSVIFSHLPGLAYRCNNDPQWTMQFVSAGCLELTGYPSESLINNKDLSFNDLIAPKYRSLLREEWSRVLPKRIPFKYEYEITTKSGEQKWVLELGQGVYNDDGEVEALEGIILDISDRKQVENNLRYVNEHDVWTGLHNLRYLEKLLKQDSKESFNAKRALISINMSTVQKLIDTHGFYYGRDLIKDIAVHLQKLCTDDRLLFSTYEIHFTFYIKNYQTKEELVAFCNSIVQVLKSVLSTERIGGGIGVFEICKDCSYSTNQLLSNILIASERAAEYSDADFGICFYDTELENKIIREQEIKRELSYIISNENDGRLYLQYQPIIDLKSNRIFAFEALARLKSDNLGNVSPVEFIPIAEKTKLIVPVGEKVFEQAFRFLKRLEKHGLSDISVSINVSVIQLLSKDFCTNLLSMIDRMQVRPQNVGLEITESVFSSDYDKINRILGELKKAGLYIAIDDFGIGYSSLARERELNVNYIKIDKYFIDRLLDEDHKKTIICDIISIAHKFNHHTVAEGVEKQSQKEYLLNSGCDKIQGYLISKPLDEDDAIDFLKKYSAP